MPVAGRYIARSISTGRANESWLLVG